MSKARLAALVILALALPGLLAPAPVAAAKKKKKKEAEEKTEEEKSPMNAGTFAGLALRGIGPAFTSGRIGDLAVDPTDFSTYYVAVASGGVWKTTNSGTTWTPIFDGEGSYSIGCVTIDPSNPLVVWVGTGENNSQRSVSYGDGVYKSVDGGKSWTNVGLGASEHIGKIVVDPRDSNIVFAAAQGPLWNAGGDRGLYKTVDGGKEWRKVLEISEHTGVTDLVYDPRDPDVMFAASYQRRRRVWTLINGGPESAIYKSVDGGETWNKLTAGLPGGDVGRIGLAISPIDPDVLFAIIEATGEAGGFYRSTDAGASWEKRSGHVSGSPQYYQEIFADPHDLDRVYSMDTWMQVTEDGGKTFRRVGERAKHVDNHALWINPNDADHLRAGCDGGVYETWDRGATWEFKANLPVTQFYRATPDNDFPIYNVYGGTQDNFSLGGPIRTLNQHGIRNSDWYVTLGGDGFKTQIDPEDPDIVYSQLQYGVLVRFDRQSGEQIFIQPQPGKDDEPLKWNWDSPLIISPHSHTRLYFGAQRLFRSDDRGDSWTPVSGDLTRRIDRNELEVMGRVWSVDAVAKNRSTSFYGNLVALAESPLAEGLLYAGTDDGLVQVTEDGGASWRRIESEAVSGVPKMTYVADLEASLHDADTVFAAFDAHKDGDFKPYLFKSTDRGRTWTSIAGDLPDRGTVYTVVQDHVEPDLLFAGTEFGVFFTVDGGERWVQLKGGMPTIAVRDVEIQRRENDLVVGTFGRGFFIFDDFTPLRGMSEEKLEQEASLFPTRRAWMYIEQSPLGLPGPAFQGDGYYTAPNPPFGAVFTYYLKDALETREKKRQKQEKEAVEKEVKISYPPWEELRAEDREKDPVILLTVADADGAVVRRLTGPTGAGFHRVAWDLRYPSSEPVDLSPPGEFNPFRDDLAGPLAVPGTYSVSLAKVVDGEVTPLAGPVNFETVPLGLAKLAAEDAGDLLAFQKKTARLQRAVLGAAEAGREAQRRIDHIYRALLDTPAADPALADEVRALEERLADLGTRMYGDSTVARRSEATLPGIVGRVQGVVFGHWTSTSPPTETFREAYRIAAEEFAEVLSDLRQLIEVDLASVEDRLEAAGGPWTPGRVPRWEPE